MKLELAEAGRDTMHTLTLVVGGLVALGAFVMVASVFGRSAADGARTFILPWLIASLVNLYLGVIQANVPLRIEIPVLAVVFGVPAAVAWFVSRRFRTQSNV
jgi:hypothetical protein